MFNAWFLMTAWSCFDCRLHWLAVLLVSAGLIREVMK